MAVSVLLMLLRVMRQLCLPWRLDGLVEKHPELSLTFAVATVMCSVSARLRRGPRWLEARKKVGDGSFSTV